MRKISAEPKNRLGLDSEENLEGFIQFVNWLSIIPYTPAIAVMTGVMIGVLFRRVRLKVAGRIFAILLALNWTLVRWLEHRFLPSASTRTNHAA